MEKYKFKRYGDELRFNYCPICKKERAGNPDFTINILKGVYFCHSTGESGTLEQLKKDYDFDFNFNLRDIPTQEKEHKPKKNFNKIFEQYADKHLNTEWLEYLSQRGISQKYLNKFCRLGKNNSMVIPVTDRKNIVALKYRTIDKKISSEKGSQTDYLMNWQNVTTFDYLIIVEGEIDLLSVIEAGYDNVVSLPFGATNIKSIENQKEWIEQFSKIIIATDNDKAGEESRNKIIKVLNNKNLYKVEYEKYKDFNEVLMTEGKEKIQEIIKNAEKIKKSFSLFSVGDDGYYKVNKEGTTDKLTDFIIKDFRYSENYFKGLAVVDGRERKFIAKRTDLLTVKGILENMGSYFGTPQSILKFWDWLKEENKERYIPEILHYGIIDDKYYDENSDVICSRQDLKIKDISQIEPLTADERVWLSDNLIYLRNDTCQSLLGVCWALGRFHVNEGYPILEVSGTTSIGKTEYVEFISRILFGSKENIKNLSTMTNHQIRSFCSCSI